MSDLKLVVNGRYETNDGYQVTIVKALKAVNKSDAREEFHYEMGFRFMSGQGVVYTDTGRIDTKGPCHLDLIKSVPSHYLVIDQRDRSLHSVIANDPEHAVTRFAEIMMVGDGIDYVDSIYELKDVTPFLNRASCQLIDKQLLDPDQSDFSLSRDEISDRIEYIIKLCSEVWNKYKIHKKPG